MKLLGELLVNMHLITREQLNECLTQQSAGQPLPLGEILVERKLITQETLACLLTVQEHLLSTAEREPKGSPRRAAPAVARYLRAARVLGASTLHLSSGLKPFVRVHGILAELPLDPVDLESCEQLLFPLLSPHEEDQFSTRRRVRFCGEIPGAGAFRAVLLAHEGGIAAVFTLLAESARSFSSLGLPPLMDEIAKHRSGLVVIAGPRGSGKSTTISSLLEHINRNSRVHVCALDEEVDLGHRSKLSLMRQCQVERDPVRRALAIRDSARSGAEVIVAGDLGSPVAIAAALEAAENRLLVIGTLPSRSATAAVVRLIEQCDPEQRAQLRSRLATQLRTVVALDLLPHADGSDAVLAWETLVVTKTIANLIHDNRVWQIPMAMQSEAANGTKLMDASLEDLLKQRKIRFQAALTRAHDKSRFARANRAEVLHA